MFERKLGGYLILSVLILVCTGCSLLIGELPKPDPIYMAASSFGPYDEKTGCKILEGKPDCSTSTQRVTKYVVAFLPSERKDFVSKLRDMEFDCKEGPGTWTCSYSKTQASRPCVVNIHVSAEVSFRDDIQKITEKDISVKSSSRRAEKEDMRGCYPL